MKSHFLMILSNRRKKSMKREQSCDWYSKISFEIESCRRTMVIYFFFSLSLLKIWKPSNITVWMNFCYLSDDRITNIIFSILQVFNSHVPQDPYRSKVIKFSFTLDFNELIRALVDLKLKHYRKIGMKKKIEKKIEQILLYTGLVNISETR